MTDFKEKIKESFTEAPDILESIKKDNRFKVPEKTQHSIFSFLKMNKFKMSFASIFVVALLLFVGTNLSSNNQVYASTVTIDINPSIEILLDEDDLVISVSALNDDGEVLIEQDVTYKKMNIDQVVERIIERAIELGYLEEDEVDNVVYIHVEGTSDFVKQRVRETVEARVQHEMQRRNRPGHVIRSDQFELTDEQLNQVQRRARELGITRGKMIYIFSIDQLDNELDDEYTLRQLALMNMRELYRVEQQLIQKGNQRGR